MTVIFQDKIIYMPYMPPFSRLETIESYANDCQGIEWAQVAIKSLDNTKISLCVGQKSQPATTPSMILCYSQGNGSSLPPRLPLLTHTLKAVHTATDDTSITLVALSYRGYWTSSGRASEAGIRRDAQAMLDWIAETYGEDANVILWGQSIGAGVACAAAAEISARRSRLKVRGLILETPFTSIKSMLIALYPQKWLPYQYLWPFLWNHWDNEKALDELARSIPRPWTLLLTAKRDEVVPPEEANKIEATLQKHSFEYDRVDIFGALHTEATTRREGQQAVASFMRRVHQTLRRNDSRHERCESLQTSSPARLSRTDGL